MKKKIVMRMLPKVIFAGALSTTLFLAACGGSDNDGPPPVYTTQILSDPVYDGDIAATTGGAFVVTQGMSADVQSVFAGIDPTTGSEYRAFLDFPLGGSGGVPLHAGINSATLEILIDSFQPPGGSLTLTIDLVQFQPPTLIESDFSTSAQPAIASITVSPPFTTSDAGTIATIDVTSLMQAAQSQGLADFQIRILEQLGPAVDGLVEIDDTTGADRAKNAPLLTVDYF